MRKKGFTLIELLAVIIILAVIALIATPVVLNVIESATNESRKNSVRGYADSVKLSYAEQILENTDVSLKELANNKTQGSKVDCEYVKYDDKKAGTLLHSCKVDSKGNYCYINGYVYEDGTAECNNIINLIMSDGIPYNTPIIKQISQTPNDTTYAQSKEISVEYPSLKVVEEKYFIKSSEILEINAIGKCGIEELPSQCTEENVNDIEPNTWYQVSGNVSFIINKNLLLEAIIGNNNEYGTKKTYEVTNIDTTKPEVIIESISTTSDKIVVNAKCTDNESGITKYEYTIDDTNYQESNMFSNLLSTNKYKVKVRCTNGSGISDDIESEEIELKEIIKPEIIQISQTPEGEYAQKRIIRITYNGTGVENPKYYYSLDGTIWTEANETTKDIEFTSNGRVYAKTEDATGNVANATTYTVANIDTTEPSVSLTVGNLKTDRATVTATCSDSESGITKYEFSKDNGSTWTDNGTTAGYTFTGLTHNKSYTFAVRCTNGSGLTKTESKSDNTTAVPAPTIVQISQTPSGTYAQSRVIRITYSSTNVQSPKYYYSLDGTNWTEVTGTTKDLTFTANGKVYAKTTDAVGNTTSASTFSVSNIDTTAPTVNATVSGKTATISLADNIGLSGYTVTTSTSVPSSWTDISGTSASKTWTASAAGTYYAWVKDVSGRTAYKAFSIVSSAFCSYTAGKTWEYAYTGGVQSFTVPCAGTYKLEVWGAQGGGTSHTSTAGGKGGYSSGNKELTKNSIIYIVVGGQGITGRYDVEQTNAGGYNGGGTSQSRKITSSYGFYGGSGGGATHIGTFNKTLAAHGSTSGLYIVAGGGGGAGGRYGWMPPDYSLSSDTAAGGSGGGTNGSTGSGGDGYAGIGGTQTAGGSSPSTYNGSFGLGGGSTAWVSGGGGGLYGGGAGYALGGAGGGSGYIGGVTGGSMSNGQQSGNGKARITLVTISN
ncbi:MAG: prepilin-type N-terminal cleavage/methylation domain-containing protein [Firmicutes bacterium]|nr:prepilin-type N-terminal cleavage/methylation domain-containing protein [Bacillota bacterium]